MRVVAVERDTISPLVLVALVVAHLEEMGQALATQQQPTLAVEEAVVLTPALRAAMAVLELLLFPFHQQITLEPRLVRQRSQLPVATQLCHLLHLGAIRHEPFCKSTRWQSCSGYCCRA